MESVPVSGAASVVSIGHAEVRDVRSALRLLLAPVVALLFWLVPTGLEPLHQKALAVTIFMVVNWIVEPFDHGLTALIGSYLFWALNVAKFSVAFSGFVNSTIWFLFCSLLMAEAASRTGLAKRLGYMLMQRAGSSSARIQTGLIVLTFMLTFFVPSGMGRIGLLASLTLGLIKGSGSAERGNFAKSSFIMMTATGGLMDVMVLSGATSMMTRGIVEEQTGIQIFWSQWLLACLPLNLLTMIASIAIIRWLYPAEADDLHTGPDYFQKTLLEMGPWTTAEKKTLLWFALAIGLWVTDSFHRINPALIGIGAGLVLSLPKIGVLDAKAAKQINFFVIIFSAGALSMGAVLLDIGVLPLLTNSLVSTLQPFITNVFAYAATLYAAAFTYHFIFANRQTMLITSLPLLLAFATSHELNVVAIALLWTIGGGGGLFIYQSGVYVLGYSYGYFDAKDFLKFGVLMTLVQAVGLAIIVPYYWPLIGLNWIK